MEENFEQLKTVLERTRAEVRKVVIGQEQAIDFALVCIFTAHHALMEGVPGVAKTLLTRTLAHVLGGSFNRVQFTPDLMPADITGTNVFNLQRDEFSLVRGPIFTTFLLADEINRAPAQTQSALLEAMQERTVTIDRETFPLPPAFTVFATQNPIEYEGTYPLPEAQKDRFMLKIPMPLPEREEEAELGRRMLAGDAPEDTLAHGGVQPVLQGDDLSVGAPGSGHRDFSRGTGRLRRGRGSAHAHPRSHPVRRRSARHAIVAAGQPRPRRYPGPRFRDPRRYPRARRSGSGSSPGFAPRV